jgi:pantoate--beta-alanine ligase
VEPDHAYFGQKDWQQFAVIRQLSEELKFNLKLHSEPTSREQDGLAMSSRNLRLNEQQREQAIVFFRALTAAKTILLSGKSISEAKNLVKEIIEQQPGTILEYFEVADSKNLNLLENVKDSNRPIMCIAGFIGEIRLIDNMFLD